MAICAFLVESLRRPTVSFKTRYVEELCKATVRAIRNLLVVEGYRCEGKERPSIDHIVDLFVPLDDEQSVKAVKYLTAYQLPRLVGDVEPDRPEFLETNSTLFTGTYGKFIDRRFVGRGSGDDPTRHRKRGVSCPSRRQMQLAFSILQLKRYLPPLPKTLRLKAKQGCKDRLTAHASTPERLIDELARTAGELFPRGWDKRPPSFSVTNKSCCESTRSAGGAQAYMFNLKYGREILEIQDFSLPSELEIWNGIEKELPRSSAALDPCEYLDLALRSQPQQLCSKMEVVEDPLKARIITKNNWQCTVLKPLQKMIHSRLRQHPSFRLIGESLTDDIINTLPRFPGSKYVSGDYEAATDNFNSDATETVLDEILSNMTGPLSKSPEYMILARKSLTGLRILDSEVGDFTMTRGQLMGSLLSFPILCIVNFAIWRHATELSLGTRCDGMGLGGPHDHVLINGDDIGFCATEGQYTLWTKLTPQVGLKPSLGKNYFCSEFITLNTQLYSWKDGKLRRVFFLNQGLLLPPGGEEAHRSTVDLLEALGPMHDDFVMGASDKEAASAVFVSHHKDLLKRSWRNLFGPREYGGLGAHPVRSSKRWNSLAGYSVRQLMVSELIQQGKIKLPHGGLRQRYDAFQQRFLDLRFPNLVRSRPADLPDASFENCWVDVGPLVDDAVIDFLSQVSWLNPYMTRPRSAWFETNRIAMKADSLYKDQHFKGDLESYLAEPEKTMLWRQYAKLPLIGEIDEDVFLEDPWH